MKKIVAVASSKTLYTKLVSSTDDYTLTTYISPFTKVVVVKE